MVAEFRGRRIVVVGEARVEGRPGGAGDGLGGIQDSEVTELSYRIAPMLALGRAARQGAARWFAWRATTTARMACLPTGRRTARICDNWVDGPQWRGPARPDQRLPGG